MKANSFFTQAIASVAITVLMLACQSTAKLTGSHLLNLNPQGVLIEGHDPVAFFTEGKPIVGSATYSLRHNDATYWFASEANRKLFQDSPSKYEVQYGGFCAYAVSLGQTAPIDINLWSIQSGRLIFQHNQRALDAWNKDTGGNLQKADKYWPQILARAGKPVIPDDQKGFLVNLNDDNYILDGYDPVAYFTDNKAVKGQEAITKLYKGAVYCFASEEHKQMFNQDPEKYLTQNGAYCANEVSRGKLRPINPDIFQFVDGRLLLQHSKQALELFNEDIAGNTKLADQMWPGLVRDRTGKPIKFDEMVMPAAKK